MTALCWWRDDDAGRVHPRLFRLLDLAEARGVPIGLAVVPAWLEAQAVARIRRSHVATVLQHGVAHADHAGPAQRKIELGGTAERPGLARALVDQRRRMEDSFGDQFLPVLVPPWNRMDADLVSLLPELGFVGLSMDRGPARVGPPRRVDVHVDAMDWQGTGRQRPLADLERAMHAALGAGLGPVGLMTHHLVVDDPGWDDLDRLLGLRHDGDVVNWASPVALFEGREPTAA